SPRLRTRDESAPGVISCWLIGGMSVAFLVPFVLADQLAVQRDLYYAVYIGAVVGLFVGWTRDTGQSPREMIARRWRLAVGLGLVAAAVSVFIAVRAEGGRAHPGGLEFVAALGWRGVVYGAADGLLLSAFPILLVFAALRDTRLRRRAGGLVVVGAVAMVASLAMTAVYHPIGAPIAHVGLHVGAVVHNYNTDLFLPPH
ncbi:MAG: hypothetical protein ABWZ63_11235, partial [Thermoleophilaceae bacterium]